MSLQLRTKKQYDNLFFISHLLGAAYKLNSGPTYTDKKTSNYIIVRLLAGYGIVRGMQHVVKSSPVHDFIKLQIGHSWTLF